MSAAPPQPPPPPGGLSRGNIPPDKPDIPLPQAPLCPKCKARPITWHAKHKTWYKTCDSCGKRTAKAPKATYEQPSGPAPLCNKCKWKPAGWNAKGNAYYAQCDPCGRRETTSSVSIVFTQTAFPITAYQVLLPISPPLHATPTFNPHTQ